MGQIARWIDSLDDAERDRIIEHPDPTYKGSKWWSNKRDCGCLVGCVIGKENALSDNYFYPPFPAAILVKGRERHRAYGVGIDFYYLAKRFGAPRMWRLVKARAAKRNRVALPEPAAV